MSLDVHSFLSTSLNLLMRMGRRRGSSGPYPILMVEKATSNGHGCADYEQPLREGKIEGRYALEMACERLEGLSKATVKDISPMLRPKTKTPSGVGATAKQDSTQAYLY